MLAKGGIASNAFLDHL